MYRSHLSNRSSAPGAKRITAIKYRATQYPNRVRQEYDEDADEYFDVVEEGALGRDIEQEISILPDEVELAESQGFEVRR